MLHQVPWPPGLPAYKGVCLTYAAYVTRKYEQETIVFGSYGTSTKSATQQRRAKRKTVMEVIFS